MKTRTHPLKRIAGPATMVGPLVLGLAQPTLAATTGWNVTSTGTYSYTAIGNWVSGTVNDTFDASLSLADDTVTGNQTLTFSADYATAGALSFAHTDTNTTSIPYNFTLRADGTGDRSLTLGGDLGFTPVRTNRLLAIGSALANEKLSLNLGSAARTFNVGTSIGTITGSSAADPGSGVTILNVVSSGTINKTGTGWLRLQGTDANTFANNGSTPALTISAGVVSLGKTAGVNAVGGDVTVAGGNLMLGNSNQIADSASVSITSGNFYYAIHGGSSSGNGARSETYANLTLSGGQIHTSPKSNGSASGATSNAITNLMSISGGSAIFRQTVMSVNRLVSTGGAITVTSIGSGLDAASEVSKLQIGAGGLEITQPVSGAFTPISIGNFAQMTLASNVVFNGDAGNTNSTFIDAAVTGSSPNLRTLGLQGATRTFTIGDGGADADLVLDADFTIVDGGSSSGITKAGLGTLRIDSSGTYTGATTVNDGRLLINGTIASAAIVNGGVLGGTGTITGGITASAGTIAPGASIGQLNAGTTVLTSASTLAIEIGAASASDLLAVTGDLTVDGTLNVIGTADASPYVIASYTGSLFGTFDAMNLPAGYTINYGTGSNSVITIAVPEPTTLAAMGLLGTLVLRRRGR